MNSTARGRRGKQPARGTLADDPQTASSPELMSGFMASLLDTGGRPRSWSAQSDRSLPCSVRSHKDSPSRPKVATTFTCSTRPVEARGRIDVKPSSLASSSAPTPTRGPAALNMMRPLAAAAAASLDSGAGADGHGVEGPATPLRSGSSRSHSSQDSSGSSTRAASSNTHSRQRSRSTGSRLPQDVPSMQASPRTQLALDVAVAEKPTAAATAAAGQSFLWSTFSRLSLDSGARKGAVDQLKDIESKQSVPHVAPPQADSAGSRWRGWWPGASSQGSNPANPDSGSAAAAAASTADAVADPAAVTGVDTAMGPEAGVDTAINPATDTAAGVGADAATPQGGEPTLPEHNQQQRKSMLLPDFDPGSSGFPMRMKPGAETAEATETASASAGEEAAAGAAKGSHELEDAAADSPLSKRLRTVGKMVVESAIEMAPAWARAALWGQRVADVLGQQGSAGPEHDAAPDGCQTKELLDASAGRLGKIAIIGVHGWFPMRMLQMLAGEPTGKSEKFCLMMRDALKAHLLESHGIAVADEDITLFPLIGEGRIGDRVELLLSQITDLEAPDESTAEGEPAAKPAAKPVPVPQDKDSAAAAAAAGPSGKQSKALAEEMMPRRGRRAQALQAADTVFVVTHSQGTPVSAMMIECLLEMGLLDTTRQRVAMLAMAGISHGPLPHLRDNVVIKYIESETARELFELMDPSSHQSQRYVAALSTVLQKGVRLVCIGSWVDEAVPLYSAILQGVSHPNVYRAVYIDAPHYLDDFLTNLIIFAVRLRNMGIYDHDLLIHLSEVVAGSLWGHWGHSTVYGEPAVYKLALKWLIYSTSAASQAAASAPAGGLHFPSIWHSAPASVSGRQMHMSYRPFNATHPLNPFYIPWIMRTLWDEPAIRSDAGLHAELQRLVGLFDAWEPKTKAGRDLKYRLEPVRAAL